MRGLVSTTVRGKSLTLNLYQACLPLINLSVMIGISFLVIPLLVLASLMLISTSAYLAAIPEAFSIIELMVRF